MIPQGSDIRRPIVAILVTVSCPHTAQPSPCHKAMNYSSTLVRPPHPGVNSQQSISLTLGSPCQGGWEGCGSSECPFTAKLRSCQISDVHVTVTQRQILYLWWRQYLLVKGIVCNVASPLSLEMFTLSLKRLHQVCSVMGGIQKRQNSEAEMIANWELYHEAKCLSTDQARES